MFFVCGVDLMDCMDFVDGMDMGARGSIALSVAWGERYLGALSLNSSFLE